MERFARDPEILWRRVLDEIMVRRLDGETAVLRGVACSVWDVLDRPMSVDALATELRRASGGDLQAARKVVEVALARLEAGRLVRRS